MAKKKIEMTAISFRLPVKLKADIEDLAASASQDVSSILIELIGNLVAANKQRIEDFRKASAMPIIKPTFANPSKPETPTKKSARATKKKSAAQIDAAPEMVTSDGSDGDAVKVGDGNAEENS